MPPPRPILALTGARGWVGRCMAKHAAERVWRVRGLVRRPGASALEIGDETTFDLGAEVPPGALENAHALIHCAYDFSALTWPEIERINVQGTRRLFEAARTQGVQMLVFISTMSAFDGAQSLYGKAKLAMEAAAREADALILRPGLVYGERAGGMYGSLAAQVHRGRLLPLIGGGGQELYLVHEEDLADVALRFCAGEFPAPSQPVTAAHERPWTLREILQEMARSEGRSVRFLPVPWKPVWWALRAAEACGLRLGFRSDSLLSLMHQDSRPDFSRGAPIDFRPRPFATASLLLAAT